MLKSLCLVSAVWGGFIGVGTLQASVVAYYQFNNSMASQVNSPTVDATAGSTVSYSSSVPGMTITDGVGGPVVDAVNTASYSNGSGTASTVANYSTLNSAVTSGSFTIEAFVKINPTGSTAYDNIISDINYVNNTTGSGWGFSLYNTGQLSFAAYQTAANAYGVAQAPSNLSTDVWHHVAAVGTYDAVNGRTQVQLYEDYTPVGAAQNFYGPAGNAIIANAASVKIGAVNPFNGLIDELRVSDQALTTAQMLHVAVPEPTSLALIGLGGIGLLLKRGRRV